MATAYIDTSVLGRVLLREPDAPAVLDELRAFERHVASRLLRVELRRLGLREGLLQAAHELVGGVALFPIDEAVLSTAETISPAAVATLDAIHLVTALRLSGAGELDAVITYDSRLAAGAREHGLVVIAP